MALMKCKECGRDVSDKAKACPNCGWKVRKPVGPVGYIIVGVLGIAVFIPIILSSIEHPQQTQVQPTQSTPAPVKACDVKAADKALNKLSGVWYRIDGQFVQVKEGWYGLPLEQKKVVDALVHCYLYGHAVRLVSLPELPSEMILYKDYRTGKDVARSSTYGFEVQ